MVKCDSKYCGCLYFSANALARNITKMAEEAFSETGLSPSYAFLVMSINSNPGIQPRDLSAEMQLTPSTITRLIEKLEYKNLAERKISGKYTEVYPTEKSLKLDETIKLAWINLYKSYSEILGEDNGKELTAQIYNATKLLEN
jgi:DNA-binding MarR family transcriptional regulator